MKITVKIGDQLYEVEIEDINQRPVHATVDGETFEVMPEAELGAPSAPEPAPVKQANANAQGINSNKLLAPLPGTVTEIFVLPGAHVEVGKPVCVIEAMKMKNTIRADRKGTIASVLVNPGQSVKHKQALVAFEERAT